MRYPIIDIVETGKRIKEICDLKGVGAKEIKSYMNFAAMQSVYDWFRGRNLPSLDNFYALSRLLEVPMVSLIVIQDEGDEGGNAACYKRQRTLECELMDLRCRIAAGALLVYLHASQNWNKFFVNQFVPGCKK